MFTRILATVVGTLALLSYGGCATTSNDAVRNPTLERHLVNDEYFEMEAVGYWSESGEFVPHGICVVKWRGTNSWAQGVMAHGSKNGWWMEWHHNGSLRSVGWFAKGYEVGEWSMWDEEGALIGQGTYSWGRSQGKWQYFHSDTGLLHSQGVKHFGVKVGEWKEYYSSGAMRASGTYSPSEKYEGRYTQSVKNGEWRYYDEAGELTRVERWTMGKLREE